MTGHEGPSIWGWRNYLGLFRRMSLELIRAEITPTTAEMMEFANEVGSADINYTELKRRVRARAAAERQCPAQHPVVALEIRAHMVSGQRHLQVFPNADGMPVRYMPIRFYLCPVCQEVFQARDTEPRGAHLVEESNAAVETPA